MSASTISESQNSRNRSRASTTVTRVPSAANIEAYSMPITPAPTTTIVCGTASRFSTPSESTTRLPSNAISGGRAGRVPTPMTIFSAVTFCPDSSFSLTRTSSVCGSTKRAVPLISRTRLRASWLRITSVSRPITYWVRASRSWTVMSSLSR